MTLVVMPETIELQKKIEDYILGRLNSQEEDALWVFIVVVGPAQAMVVETVRPGQIAMDLSPVAMVGKIKV